MAPIVRNTPSYDSRACQFSWTIQEQRLPAAIAGDYRRSDAANASIGIGF